MARHKPTTQIAFEEEDANDSADAQEDGTPDIDDEGLASMLNAKARKRVVMPTRASEGTWVQRLAFALVGGVNSEQDEHILGNGNDDHQEEELEEQIEEEAVEPIDEQDGHKKAAEVSRGYINYEEARHVTPTPTFPTSLSPSNPKRDEVGDISEEHEEPPRKRITGARKAKSPIIAPKTSVANDFDIVTRAPGEKHVGKASIETPAPEQQAPLNRSRGRPKKTMPDAEESEPNQPPSAKNRKGRQLRNSTPKPQPIAEDESSSQPTPISPAEIPVEELGTVSPILESPSPQKKSPVKLTRKDVELPPISRIRPRTAVRELPELSQDEEEGDAGHQSDLDLTPPQLYPFPIEANILDNMIEEAGWVGHRQNRDTKQYDEIWVVKKPHSKVGQVLYARLRNLSDAYEELRRSKTNLSEAEIRAIKARILESLGRLRCRTESTLRTKLADSMRDTNDLEEETIKKTLIDLYFIVLPKWLECIKVAIEVYDEDGSMSLTSLEQLQNLLNLYCNLADAALQQSSQPEAVDIIPEKNSNRSRQFRIKQPTKVVLREAQRLRLEFTHKIKAIAREEHELEKQEVDASRAQLLSEYQESVQSSRLEETRKKRLEREEKRRAADEAKIREKEKQKKLRDEQQARDFARFKAANASFSAALRRRCGNRKNAAQRAPEIVYSNSYQGGDEFDDPFSDNYQSNFQRVKVFPSNNKSNTTAVKWTDKNMEIFIECMSKGSKDAKRYENAATLLGCSLEQVFEAAKELQETYDKMHENGEMNGEDDGFSYDVWVKTGNV